MLRTILRMCRNQRFLYAQKYDRAACSFHGMEEQPSLENRPRRDEARGTHVEMRGSLCHPFFMDMVRECSVI